MVAFTSFSMAGCAPLFGSCHQLLAGIDQVAAALPQHYATLPRLTRQNFMLLVASLPHLFRSRIFRRWLRPVLHGTFDPCASGAVASLHAIVCQNCDYSPPVTREDLCATTLGSLLSVVTIVDFTGTRNRQIAVVLRLPAVGEPAFDGRWRFALWISRPAPCWYRSCSGCSSLI